MINKKAQAGPYALGILVVKGVFTLAAFFFTYLIISQGYNLNLGDREVDAEIVAQTLVYSPVLTMSEVGCTNRLYPAWINSTKFDNIHSNETSLALENYMMMYDDVNYMVMNISLMDNLGNKKGSIYYRKDKYFEFLTYVKGDFLYGSGGYKQYKHVFPVSIDKSHKKGIMVADIIIPNG